MPGGLRGVAAEPEAVRTPAPASGPGPATGGQVALSRAIGNRAFARLARQALQRDDQPTVQAEREVDARWSLPVGSVPTDVLSQIAKLDRFAVAFYEDYTTGKPNDAEFAGAARDFAATYQTVGLIPGTTSATLKIGAPTPVKNRSDVLQVLASLHQTLYHVADNAKAAPVRPIDTVAIFAHGVRLSLGLDPEGETGPNWFRASKIPEFADAIRPHVSPNVRVLLFACSTGASSDDESNYKAPVGGDGGKGSFAEQLANALGGGAKVFAHDVYAHTESNPYARVFSAGSDTGTDIFKVLYDDAFVAAELKRLKESKADLVGGVGDEQLKAALRKQMWDHFYDAVSRDFARINTKSRHFSIGGYGGVGAAMFMDPGGTAGVLHADFSSVWLTDERIKKLGR